MSGDTQVSPGERCGEARRQICLDGEIIFRNGSFRNQELMFDCLVQNWSNLGAHLLLPSTGGIPDHFVLNIKYINKRSPARVIWRDEASLGVEFDDTAGDVVLAA